MRSAFHGGRNRIWFGLVACVLVVVFALCRDASANDFSSRFSVVMIDDETEARLGAFPFDRSIMAQAVNACADRGARAVVLKFFFDLPRSPAGDQALREALGRVPVALQAALEGSDLTRPAIPAKFAVDQDLPVMIRRDRGMFPLPLLLEKAAAFGFVDFHTTRIPMVEGYGDQAYKSLVVCALELALDKPAVFSPNRIRFGQRVLAVDDRNVFRANLPPVASIKLHSFVDLLQGRVPAGEIKSRVVIIGYNASKVPKVAAESGAWASTFSLSNASPPRSMR